MGPRVFNCDTRPFFIGRETSIVARLEHSPQTDKTLEMPRDKNNIMLSVISIMFVFLPSISLLAFTLIAINYQVILKNSRIDTGE